jgi:hypothetical protein
METYHLTPRETLGIVPQICEALEYAHGEGIVHRDIKPENILLDQKGRVKVADFGLSKLLEPGPQDIQLTQTGQVLGTMHYMAPEQLEKPLEVDQRADIYSLGVVLYEMLTGELPLGRFELPSKKAAVDPRLDELILHAMERNPRQRCQSAGEVRLRLETIAGVTSRLSPEVNWKLSYEYRTKTTWFGWPLLHVAVGVNPATGRKRSARGIIAVGTAPRGIIAFGDEAVGVIACGIFGFGVVSFSVIAVGIFACGSVAAGLVFAMGGMAIAPVAMGGLTFGWFASGAMAWGKHALTPTIHDSAADKFFNPHVWKFVGWVFRAMIIAVPLFLALGFLPKLMARISERRRQRRFHEGKSKSV